MKKLLVLNLICCSQVVLAAPSLNFYKDVDAKIEKMSCENIVDGSNSTLQSFFSVSKTDSSFLEKILKDSDLEGDNMESYDLIGEINNKISTRKLSCSKSLLKDNERYKTLFEVVEECDDSAPRCEMQNLFVCPGTKIGDSVCGGDGFVLNLDQGVDDE